MEKYLVLFLIPEPFRTQLCQLMDEVARVSGLPPPHLSLPPHMTFHRPLAGIDECVMKNIVQSAALQMHQTRVTLHALFPFGEHYIVLPVQATKSVAALWVEIGNLLSRLPEYEHDQYDGDNTLHVTIAAKTTPLFDRVWATLRTRRIDPMTMRLTEISLYKKSAEGGVWTPVETFLLPA